MSVYDSRSNVREGSQALPSVYLGAVPTIVNLVKEGGSISQHMESGKPCGVFRNGGSEPPDPLCNCFEYSDMTGPMEAIERLL